MNKELKKHIKKLEYELEETSGFLKWSTENVTRYRARVLMLKEKLYDLRKSTDEL